MDATADDSTAIGDDVATPVSDSGMGGGGDAADTGPIVNPPDAAPLDAGTPWAPSALPGLALWLDAHQGLGLVAGGADAGDAGPSLLWLDQSGHSNNAAGAGSPVIKATALGGQPAVHFNGSTDYLVVQDSPSLQWGTGDFVVALVVQHTTFQNDAGPVYGTLYSKQIADVGPYYGVGLFVNTPSKTSAILGEVSGPTTVTSGGVGYNNGAPFVVMMHRTIAAADAGLTDAGGDAAVGALGLVINGQDAGVNAGAAYAHDVSATGYVARIGGTQYGQDMTGDIAEVIGVQGAVSDADLAKLEAYLKAKYGL